MIPTTIFTMKEAKKCAICKKRKSKILLSQYEDALDEVILSAFCIDCFKKEFPNYTLEKMCLECEKCFKCTVQRLLFTPVEIHQFRKKHFIMLL